MDAVTATSGLLLAVASFYLTAGLQTSGLAQLVSAQVVLGTVALCVALRGGAAATTLGLRAPSTQALVGAALIGASAWVPNLRLAVAIQTARGAPLRVENLERLLETPHAAITIACLALVPALCEELAFRGLWGRALAARFGVVTAILVSSPVFGAYHLAWGQGVPATLLGAVLAWISLRGCSLWLSVAAHAINNAVAILAARGELAGIAWSITAYPRASLGIATMIMCAGFVLIATAPTPSPPRNET
jgi:sodium transport system permease protein